MQTRSQRLRFYGGMFVLAFGSLVIWLVSVAQGPDLTLHFERNVPSDESVEDIGNAIQHITEWPKWFYSTVNAQAVDLTGTPYPMADQVVMRGSLVRLYVDPHKGRWKKFEVNAAVTDYVPNQRIQMHFLNDTKGKINRLFDRLDWTITIEKRDGKTWLHGVADAHTCHWRSRFFGRVAEKILMNNVFYPDLFKLAELKRPPAANPLMPPSAQ
ncbi:MAG: hypothetical protein ACXWP5_15460 [Bdellovibrionota bacterium]